MPVAIPLTNATKQPGVSKSFVQCGRLKAGSQVQVGGDVVGTHGRESTTDVGGIMVHLGRTVDSKLMPELVLELGCEELPASFIGKALDDWASALHVALTEAKLEPTGLRTYATPRRLIVGAKIADRQPDEVKTVRGPAAQAAYGPDGAPSKALEGFCRGQGVDPSAAFTEGDYVWVKKDVVGRSALEVVAEVAPATIRGLSFAKTMRWAHHRTRFARPIRWVVALVGGEVAPFTLDAVQSGNLSRGHRFNHPEPFTVTSFDQLIDELRSREVEPDPTVRIGRISEQAEAVSGGRARLSDDLIIENAYLTEWPTAVLGEFDPRFLRLPEPVLTTVMAKHERFFPVQAAGSTELTNQFVSIRNGGETHTVAKGNAWVLNCRFADADFFFEEDRKYDLDVFLKRTEGIVFQAKLGTVRERADRLAFLARALAEGADPLELAHSEEAGKYAKADLSSGLVSELDELQGVVGGLYAAREGRHADVCHAIATHYSADLNPNTTTAGARIGLRLTLADQLDKLAGYLGLGMVPSGSSDPYGLRRAAGIVLEIALRWPEADLQLDDWLGKAIGAYMIELDREAAMANAEEVFRQRYATLFEDVPADWLDAIFAADARLVFAPHRVASRLEMLRPLAADVPFLQAAIRPLNITSAAEKKGIAPVALDASALDSAESSALLAAAEGATKDNLPALVAPINAFFDATMVMVDDARVRDARLALLRLVGDRLKEVADFSKIVIAG